MTTNLSPSLSLAPKPRLCALQTRFQVLPPLDEPGDKPQTVQLCEGTIRPQGAKTIVSDNLEVLGRAGCLCWAPLAYGGLRVL